MKRKKRTVEDTEGIRQKRREEEELNGEQKTSTTTTKGKEGEI